MFRQKRKLGEIIILMGKIFARNVVIFALFFEVSIPKICLLKN